MTERDFVWFVLGSNAGILAFIVALCARYGIAKVYVLIDDLIRWIKGA